LQYNSVHSGTSTTLRQDASYTVIDGDVSEQ